MIMVHGTERRNRGWHQRKPSVRVAGMHREMQQAFMRR